MNDIASLDDGAPPCSTGDGATNWDIEAVGRIAELGLRRDGLRLT
jgi:hypothetical protein